MERRKKRENKTTRKKEYGLTDIIQELNGRG